ncbi:MAG: adenylosuccinate lyase [Gemmatimonadota bacterium]|nr:MAG: adenylosuccinate lyase [Gemmatimonadota bacterium]
MTDTTRYQSPLGTRYSSPRMQSLWSAKHRARLWRELWLTLAEEQKRLGLDIPDTALEQMREHLDNVDLDVVRKYEQRFRHDVMAHVHAFGDQAPAARPFIHLGATSCYVTDNSELLVMRDSLHLLLGRLVAVIKALSDFALEQRNTPTLAYTHFQPAQLTTVGKRAAMWLQDFYLDAVAVFEVTEDLMFRGCKGVTGTQASYLDLFHGDHDKVKELDRSVSQRFGFDRSIPLTGQTYTRKIDSRIMDLLSGIAQSAAKFATDMRLLQHEGEILEPFESEQIGSSAMAYKRNPMRAERICAIARHIITLNANAANTAATQWLERTLDDSANRRLTLPEAFLATDAVLILCTNVCAGLVVNPAIIERNVRREMPFMATERWLMIGVEAGGDRQTLHEVVRRHSVDVRLAMAQKDVPNDLLERLSEDEGFANVDANALRAELDPMRYVGRAPHQVSEFIEGPIAELLKTLTPYSAPDEAMVSI